MSALICAAFADGNRAEAGTITYTCDSSIGTYGATGMCNYLTTTIAGKYATLFSDATANIYVEFGNETGLSENVNNQSDNYFSYTAYRNALIANSSGDAVDTAAIASLPTTDPINGATGVDLTSALATALNLTVSPIGVTAALGACTMGNAGCYNGVIILDLPSNLTGGDSYYYRTGPAITSKQYDIYSLVEHETDEILGTASCIVDGNGVALYDGCGGGITAPVDLFRYSSSGTRTAYPSTGAGYFSYNGGVTNVGTYNSAENGEDYADFSSTCTHVQDATGCLGHSLDITTDGGAEATILDALGYNTVQTTVTPEPGGMALLGLGVACMALTRFRRV